MLKFTSLFQEVKTTLRKYIGGIVAGGVLFWLACIQPWGYDDAGHLLAATAFAETGIWGFPKSSQEVVSNSLFVTVGPTLHLPIALLINAGIKPEIAGRFWVTLHSLLLLWIVCQFRPKNSSTCFWASFSLLAAIQFLSYGTRYLGEIPGLTYLFLTLWSLSKNDKNYWLAIIWGCLAIFSKEYFLFPLFGIIFSRIIFNNDNTQKEIVVALLWFFSIIAFYGYTFDNNLDAIANYWREKAGYRNEFFVFSLESVRFLFFKPLIVLGTAALWAEYWTKRNQVIREVALTQTLLLLIFIASAGYDRFGLWLLPGAVIGIAPWLLFLERQIATKSIVVKFFLWILVFVLLSQRSLPTLIHWSVLWKNNNYSSQQVAQFFQNNINEGNLNGTVSITTCEVELALALKNYHWQLPTYPPMAAHKQSFPLRRGDWFIAGPFSESVYNFSFKDAEAVRVTTIPIYETTFFRHFGQEYYTIYHITDNITLRPGKFPPK